VLREKNLHDRLDVFTEVRRLADQQAKERPRRQECCRQRERGLLLEVVGTALILNFLNLFC
jgi:hypothetical protein